MRKPPTLVVVILALFLSFVGFGSTLPLLPLYLRQDLGLDRFWTGVLIGVLNVTALLGRLWAGPFLDRNGRRSGLWLGFGLCALSGVLYLPVFGLYGMAAARLIHGVGEAFLLTGGVAWAVDAAPEGRRSQALGYLASGVWGGLAVGPLVANVLSTFPKTAILVSASALLAALLLLLADESQPDRTAPRSRLRLGVVALPGSILGFTNLGYAVMAAFMPLLLDSRSVPGGPAFTAFAGTVLCSRLVLGSLPDRLGPRTTLIGGLAIMTVGLALMMGSHSINSSVVAAAVVGFGYSFPWPSLALIVVDRVADYERASALAGLTAFYDLFVAVGSAVAGSIGNHFGLLPVFWFATASVAVGLLVVLFTGLGRPRTNAIPISSERTG